MRKTAWWTYSGIKRYRPDMPFEAWVTICKLEQNRKRSALAVVGNVRWPKSSKAK
jgi:hypothetical protein